MIGDKIANEITQSPPRTSARNTSETVPSKTEDKGIDAKIRKEKYISQEKRQQITDELRLMKLDNEITLPSKFELKIGLKQLMIHMKQ